MPKTPPLDKAKALRRVVRELQDQQVAGTLIPGDEPVSMPDELVKLLRSKYPDRSTSWIYETVAAIRGEDWAKRLGKVEFTMASSGSWFAEKIQPQRQQQRRVDLAQLRRDEWGPLGGRPRKA